MKHLLIALSTLAVLVACNNQDKTRSTDSASTLPTDTTESHAAVNADNWVPVDSATAMKTMMAAGTPGKEQNMLAKDDGKWKAETTMWMSPGAAPLKSTGTVTNKMVMGGRYQVSNFKGDMMNMPFEGTSTTGYDNARKVWVSTWIDNMSTGILTMEGTWDDATKTATYTGKVLCPANNKMCEMKQTFKMIDENNQLMEMYGPDMQTGKQFKNMEMKLTRSK